MSRTREEIIADIEYFTKEAEYYKNNIDYRTELANQFTKSAEYCTNLVELAKQELKELDEKEKGGE